MSKTITIKLPEVVDVRYATCVVVRTLLLAGSRVSGCISSELKNLANKVPGGCNETGDTRRPAPGAGSPENTEKR
jgi:hypothetical protein